MPSQQPISDDGRDGPLPSHERAGGSGKSAPGVPELAGLSEFNPNAAFAAEALELLPSGFVALTLDGRQLHSNKAFRSMAGREGTVLAGMKFDEFLSRGSAIFYEMHFAPSLLLRGALDEIAFDLLRPDGVQIPVFVKASIRSGSDGGASQLPLTVSNARQRRLYESELLRAKREFEELAEIVRRSADGIIRFNADGIIQSWNHGAEQIFGYSFEECKGRSVSLLFPADEQDLIDEAMGRLRGGVEVYREALALDRSARLIDISISLTLTWKLQERWWVFRQSSAIRLHARRQRKH